MNLRIFLLVFLLPIIIKAFEQSDIENENENKMERFDEFSALRDDEIEIPCTFAEAEASRICDCGYKNEQMVLPQINGNMFQITLRNCKILRIPGNTFSRISQLTRIIFHNIEDLVLDEYSLFIQQRQNRVKLEFYNTIIEQLSSHAIRGNIDELIFENIKFGLIQSFAVSGTGDNFFKILIKDSTINRIDPQAFKKFTVTDFEISNSNFLSDLPSRSIIDVEVTDTLRITDSNFTTFHPSSFMFNEIGSLTMINNKFTELNGESFRAQVRNSINIRDNNFGLINSAAFSAIRLDNNYFSRNSEPMIFHFSTNTLSMANGHPTTIQFFERFNLRIIELRFIEAQSCESINNLMENQFLSSHSDQIYFKVIEFDTTNRLEYFALSHIINNQCIATSYLVWIIVGISCISILILVLLTILICHCCKRRKARQLNIVMPEGKTYRETEIIMQIENHNLLKTDL